MKIVYCAVVPTPNSVPCIIIIIIFISCSQPQAFCASSYLVPYARSLLVMVDWHRQSHCYLPFAINVVLNLSIRLLLSMAEREILVVAGTLTRHVSFISIQDSVLAQCSHTGMKLAVIQTAAAQLQGLFKFSITPTII